MSASVSGPEPRDGSQHASTRRLVGTFAIVTTLLTTSFAAAPAWGQDAGATSPNAPGQAGAPPPPPPPVPPAPTAPTSGSGRGPAAPSPPAIPDVPPVKQHSGAGVPASGDTEDLGSQRPPGRAGGDDRSVSVYSTEGLTTTMSLPTKSADPVKKPQLSAIARGNPGSLRGQNPSVVDKQGRSDGPGSAAKNRHAIAQISPLGALPGFGNQLPSRNPSFSLLRGPGSAAAGLALAGLMAVLGAAFVLRRDRSRMFRMPTVTWRPLAYVPPIELPG